MCVCVIVFRLVLITIIGGSFGLCDSRLHSVRNKSIPRARGAPLIAFDFISCGLLSLLLLLFFLSPSLLFSRVLIIVVVGHVCTGSGWDSWCSQKSQNHPDANRRLPNALYVTSLDGNAAAKYHPHAMSLHTDNGRNPGANTLKFICDVDR